MKKHRIELDSIIVCEVLALVFCVGSAFTSDAVKRGVGLGIGFICLAVLIGYSIRLRNLMRQAEPQDSDDDLFKDIRAGKHMP